ncbi:hypothetical protein TRIUR3_32430 [Triticum urartu]|uniref:Plant bHLH transcription factor ACT-like domain-containing protein n=1 Tax=Triticum urartu TaxID=4572 RepID=M7YXK7_TRIUA|nr:hypothetical protein TRIUR3_32430 [Triticum urartu]
MASDANKENSPRENSNALDDPLAAKTGGRTRHAPVDEEELRRRRSTDCIYYLALPLDLQEVCLKFEVECKEEDTRVEIYCAAKPGLLLLMVSTLDTLSLNIQQCVVDCFNDFTMHASCSKAPMIPSMDSMGPVIVVDLEVTLIRKGLGGDK